jgi:hypothetical protein
MIIIEVLSVWLPKITRRLIYCARHILILGSASSSVCRGSVEFDGRLRHHLNFQNATVRIGAFAMLLVTVPAMHAFARHDVGAATGLEENLKELSPELAGGKWGWHLTRYSDVGYSIKIAGRVYLVLSTDPQKKDNVVWDPLTGLGRHIDHDQWVRMIEARRQSLSIGILFPGQSEAIPDDRILRYEPAPGVGMPSCSPNFNGYFEVYNSSQNLLRSFYVVTKIADPSSVRYHICIEGSGGHLMVKPPITIDFESGQIWSYALADGTLLFVTGNKGGTTIVRLDDKLRQHTSVDGRAFVLDAAGINAKLGPSPDIQDPTFRYQVFLAAIEAAKKAGLHYRINP